MGQQPQVSALDIVAGPGAVGPAGAVRISRNASGLVASVDGGTPAAIAGGGTCAEDVWGGAAASFVASKVSTLTNVVLRSRCATAFSLEMETGGVAGTGVVTQDTTQTGGVYHLTTGATAASRIYVRNKGAGGAAGVKTDLVPNIRTAKWAVIVRFKIISVNATCLNILGDMTDTLTSDVYWGVRGQTSQATYVLVVGATVQNTGVAIDNSWHTFAMIGDGTNVSLWDVDTGAQVGTSMVQSDAPAVAGHFRCDVLNQGTASAVTQDADDIQVITEQAA